MRARVVWHIGVGANMSINIRSKGRTRAIVNAAYFRIREPMTGPLTIELSVLTEHRGRPTRRPRTGVPVPVRW